MPHLPPAFVAAHGHAVWPHVLLPLPQQLPARPGLLPRRPPEASATTMPYLQPAGAQPAGQTGRAVPVPQRVPAEHATLRAAAPSSQQVSACHQGNVYLSLGQHSIKSYVRDVDIDNADIILKK